MLPLISNVLPTLPQAPTAAPATNPALLLSGSSDAAARQQLPSAVVANTPPAAYFPGTAPQRELSRADDRTLRVPVPPPTGDYIEVAQPEPTSTAGTRFSTPVTLGIPLTTQLNAQVLAQQTARAANDDGEPLIAVRNAEATPSRTKEPSLSTAKGASAYGLAAARTAQLAVQAAPEPEPEPVAAPEELPTT